MKSIVAVLFFILFSYYAYGQRDSVFELKEVPITDNRLITTNHFSHVDSINIIPGQSLPDLISSQSNAFVKDNGGGRLATISIRGTSASENNVSWNGIALNTPTLGLYDLSIMPVFFIDELTVQYGSNGSLNGGDATGGLITMSSRPDFNKGFRFEALSNVSGFQDFEEGIKLRYSSKNIYMRSAIYRHDAVNNYPVSIGEIKYTQKHASFFTEGICNDITLMHKQQLFSIHFIALNARHEIPAIASSLTAISSALQFDNQIRTALQWQLIKDKFDFHATAGFTRDIIHYTDSSVFIDDFSNGYTLQANAEINYRLKSGSLLTGIQQRNAVAIENSTSSGFNYGYTKEHSLPQTGIYIRYLYTGKKLEAQTSIRYDAALKNNLPLIPSASLKWVLHRLISIKANASAIYRPPTLNDLYWTPGGNPNLLPEKGKQFDFFILNEFTLHNWKTSLQSGLFLIDIHDYIQWLPGASNIYSPVNEDRFISRGTELSLKESRVFKRWRISFRAAYNYTQASTEKENHRISFNDDALQAIYIPRTGWNLSLEVARNKTTLRFNSGYTGYRYISKDNAYWLDPYSTSSITLQQALTFHKNTWNLFLSMSNLQNTNYEIVPGRPVAGMNFHAGINYLFN